MSSVNFEQRETTANHVSEVICNFFPKIKAEMEATLSKIALNSLPGKEISSDKEFENFFVSITIEQ